MGRGRPKLDPERVELIRTMTRDRKSAAEIAALIGVASRTVSRWRVRLGIAKPRARPWTDGEKQHALALLLEGCPCREVAATCGRTEKSVIAKFPRMGLPHTAPTMVACHRLERELGLR